MRNSPSLNVGQSCLNVEKKRISDQHLNMLKKGEEIRNSETFDQWNAALCSAFLSKKRLLLGQIQSAEPSAG